MSRRPDTRRGPRYQLEQARAAWRIIKSLVRARVVTPAGHRAEATLRLLDSVEEGL